MLASIFVLTFAFLFLYFLFLFQYIFVCAKRQTACVLFVIFGVECLCTVCCFILCAEQQNVCVLVCYFWRRWLFDICFAVSKKGYQVQKFVVLIFYNFVSIFAFICFDICFYCFNLLYF